VSRDERVERVEREPGGLLSTLGTLGTLDTLHTSALRGRFCNCLHTRGFETLFPSQ
jgi:hypothetical protein